MFFSQGNTSAPVIPEIITGEWLMERLKKVLSFANAPLEQILVMRELKHHHSRIIFFQAIYSSDHVHGYPVCWVAKIRTNHEGAAEGQFYQLAREQGFTRYLPEFGGLVDLGSGSSLVLLKNINDQYRLMVSAGQVYKQGSWNPSFNLITRTVKALAQFHTDWWQSELLTHRSDIFLKGSWWGRKSDFIENLAERENQVKAFKSAHSLSSTISNLLEQSIKALPDIEIRLHQQPLTIAHGDCYPWHFFVSRVDQSFKLFDFEFVGYNTPAHDLVSLLVYWRGDLKQILEYYCQCLTDNGIGDYDINLLKEDMRLTVYSNVLTMIQDWHRGCSEALWSSKLQGLLNVQKKIVTLRSL